MAFDFPETPTLGQEYTLYGMTYTYTGVGWAIKSDIYTQGESDTRYVNTIGDTMTGQLVITRSTGGAIAINKSNDGYPAAITGRTNAGSPRWQLFLANSEAETADAGSNFEIYRFNDAGGASSALNINRLTGNMTLTGDLTVNKSVPRIFIDKPAGAEASAIIGRRLGLSRWSLQLGGTDVESTGNLGSNLVLYRFNDAGSPIDAPLIINRATGTATMSGELWISAVDPRLRLDKASGASGTNAIVGRVTVTGVPLNRWALSLGDGAAESTGNVGSDFQLSRYDNAGAAIGGPVITITRATGLISLSSDLTITKVMPTITLSKTDTNPALVLGHAFGKLRWRMVFADGTAESGSNAGSNFQLQRYADDGTTQLSSAFSINRASGDAAFSGGLLVTGRITANGTGNTIANAALNVSGSYAGGIALSDPGFGYGLIGGSSGNLTFATGTTTAVTIRLTINTVGDITVTGKGIFGNDVRTSRTGGASGVYYFGASSGSTYLYFDGTSFSLSGGGLSVPSLYSGGTISAAGAMSTSSTFSASGALYAYGRGYQPGGGDWGDSSDIRIKTVIGDYDNGLAAILTLNPIRYVFKGNDTASENVIEHYSGPKAEETTAPYSDSFHYKAAVDETEFIGLVAQDIETTFPEMVTKKAATIDGEAVDDLRILNTSPLIYALVNAVKELATRLETLEMK